MPETKNWQAYFLEFLLIFLAVALGFFAESIREDMGDQEKEREFIRSMIEDAALDTLHFNEAIEENQYRSVCLDSLGKILCRNVKGPAIETTIYRLFRVGLNHPAFVSPTERTMTQLKNAGGMRLIRKKSAVDAIVRYDDMAKYLVDQQAFYELYQNSAIEHSIRILNFEEFKIRGRYDGEDPNPFSKANLLNNDPIQLVEFGNRVNIYSAIVQFYNVRLKQMKHQAKELISTLQDQYEMSLSPRGRN